MIFLKLYRFFMGKLKLEASGDFSERILNLCAHNGIAIWAIRNRNGKITFYITVRDFRYLRKIIRGTHIRVHIVKKRGWPFIIKRYSHRYGIMVGLPMFFAVLQMLSLFLWNINVSGNIEISDKEIIKACEEIGVYEGVRIARLDEQKLRLKLLGEVDTLAWAAFNIEGSTLTVDVTEIEEKGDNSTDPCNIVASANGIIRSIEVEHGKSLVKVGDSVAADQLLVSGIYEYKDGSTVLEHASARIMADVSEIVTVTVPIKQKVNVLSHEEKVCHTLNFFGIKIPLYLGSFSDDYLRQEREIKMQNGKNYLPIYLQKSTFKKVSSEEIIISEDMAKTLARAELDKRFDGIKILSSEEKIVIENDAVVVTYEITTQRDIAKEEILLFGTTN